MRNRTRRGVGADQAAATIRLERRLVNTQRGAIRIGRVAWLAGMGAGDAAPTAFPSSYSLEFHCMPTQTRTTRPILHDAIAVGSDFVGGTEAMPVRPTEPGPIVPGSDFAGGALPLTAEAERGQPNEERAA
jgi:hypothetical protein